MTDNEWVSVWMFSIVKRRKKIDKFVYQALKNVVKDGDEDVLQNFKKKFKELRVEVYRKDGSSASVMYTKDMNEDLPEDKEDMDEDLPEEHSTEKELETMYMGTESEARRRFQRTGPYRRQSFGRPRSSFRDSRYNSFRRLSRFGRSRTRDGRNDRDHDQS